MISQSKLDLRFQLGFTLVELVTIIVIVGILAVVAAPRFFDNDVFRSRGAADQVKAILRYGQKVAIAQHRNVMVKVSAGANPACEAVLAGGTIDCIISNNVTLVPANNSVTFNSLGQPNAGTQITVGATAINVEPETGYVH